MFNYFYHRSYLTFALIIALFIIGVMGLISMPKNLFPDSDRPTIIVITQISGATAKVAASTVSKPIEEEISRLAMIREVSSVNVANFSIVKGEFEYEKGLDAAAVDVNNALSIASSKLPAGANPAIYTSGAFTRPVEVITLSSKNSNLTLPDLRKIADSFIKPYLLSKPDIGNVEVFGGYQSAINIELDPLKAKKYGLDFNKVANVITATNKDMPLGFLKGKNGFFTLTYYGDHADIDSVKNIFVAPNVHLKDIAKVKWGYQKRFSGYMGNGKEGIAMAVQRAPGGSVLDVSKATRTELEKLKVQYPNIEFQISDTQRDLIETANDNMLEALRDAVIYTLIVMMFFLGNFRAIIAAGLSIPLVFFGTIAIIYLFGGELNIVVYTAIILALGMLVDDAVVVLENIERHISEVKEDLNTAIEEGTKEVLSPIFSGTVATIVIMFPLMFVGDFPQHIFRPLISTLIIALLVSYFLSITFIPKLSLYLYKNGTQKNRIEKFFERLYQASFGRLVAPYISILHFTNGRYAVWRKLLLTVGVLALLIISVSNIMPIIGKDTMPPMDTGIIKAHIVFSANDRVEDSEAKMKPFLTWLHQQPEVTMSSVAFGSETGVLSLGSGNLPSEAIITINCVNRFQRKKSLWTIEDEIRDQLHTLLGIKTVEVYDFGATPMSSIKAPLDVRITSSDFENLPEMAEKVAQALAPIKGLTSITQSWASDFNELKVDIDTNKALSYGLTPAAIAEQIPINGRILSMSGSLSSMSTQYVRLYLKGSFSEDIQSLKSMLIQTPAGDELPLTALATISNNLTQAKIERDQMLYSIDVNGFRTTRPVTHITSDAIEALKTVNTAGYNVTQQGDIISLNDSFTRMIKAIATGIVILAITLIVIYRSVGLGLIMIVVLPLSLIGASWGMLLFDKPSCMPSLIGILLLFGIIIKNAVLLVDFYQDFRKKESPFESAVESVRVRFRPVMMTAFGTIAGMIPIALEQAVGLERLSPLADVAIGGLIVGTLLTLVYVPMFAYGFDRDK
ncbi:efflux RND transporter permease subunit [Shewanella polaris]|uniref:Efflux RND transporter permease subunit n=1 Tax=Shewanella polaris TaxID=2588449 RepID=A0A4Y5YK00_9GAMM|nr:efflux RND transporter permease subunit [Shewanella polaris]QDE32813.1 efflux RND transporter permease subunit [Shewanella polaris]